MDSKAFLYNFKNRYFEIESADELCRILSSKMTNTAARPTDGIYTNSGAAGDVYTFQLHQLEEARQRLRELLAVQESERGMILKAVDRLPVQQRSIIQFRYIADMKWTEVTQALFGHLDEYELKAESYLRRVNKSHGSALQKLDTILENIQSQQGQDSV